MIKLDYIMSQVKSELGVDILGSDIADYTHYIQRAVHDYFVAKPLVHYHSVSANYGMRSVDLGAFATEHFGADAVNYAILGLVSIQFVPHGLDIDYTLTGGRASSPFPLTWTNYPELVGDSFLQSLLRISSYDHFSADIAYRMESETELILISPGAGDVTMGIGFAAQHADLAALVNKLPAGDLTLIGDLSAEHILSAAVAGRGAIRMGGQAPVLDTTYLSQRLSELRENNTKALSKITLPVAFMSD